MYFYLIIILVNYRRLINVQSSGDSMSGAQTRDLIIEKRPKQTALSSLHDSRNSW
jgi:hypothetical protein